MSVVFTDRTDNGCDSQKQEFAVQEDHGGKANVLPFLVVWVNAAQMHGRGAFRCEGLPPLLQVDMLCPHEWCAGCAQHS